METKKNIAAAIVNVMKAVKGVEKGATVGFGNNSYKGVSDKDVKKVVGDAMASEGLSMLPISVEPSVTVERWDDNGRQKQSVFTEVKTKYLLLHTSGESIELAGYGHGIDSQDKGAGKATTYALKYALLYAFLVPTGDIDDADKVHSDEVATPPRSLIKKDWLNPNTDTWTAAVNYLKAGNSITAIKSKYELTPANEEKLKTESL
jgi:hypothetical protein